jgi:hypothetical protein
LTSRQLSAAVTPLTAAMVAAVEDADLGQAHGYRPAMIGVSVREPERVDLRSAPRKNTVGLAPRGHWSVGYRCRPFTEPFGRSAPMSLSI